MKDLFVNHAPVLEKETTGNAFLGATTKKNTTTENGALSNSSTGSTLVDDFANAGSYRGRSFDSIDADMSALWAESPIDALRFTLYLRLVTRKIKGFFETESPQRGQGNKDESLKRMLWIAYKHPETFYANLWLLPLVGCWKDLWVLMGIDHKNELDHSKFFELMKKGLAHDDMKDLVLKYMPQIKAESKCKTTRAKVMNQLAKEFAKDLGITQKEYRKMKASGVGHVFQQKISRGLFAELDWNRIPGKALTMLVSGKFLGNNKLEKSYLEWIKAQPTAKFTGYVYELYTKGLKATSLLQTVTYDKQFDGLIALAKEKTGAIQGNVWCALDTSGSMESHVTENARAIDICVSLGIYFSALNEGAFKDHVIMFDNKSTVKKLKGTFTEKIAQIRSMATAWGGTNFQSVIDEIVRIRKQFPDVPVSDYPTTLLVVSDMQFNPAGNGDWRGGGYGSGYTPAADHTNYEAAMAKLEAVGLPRIGIVWWDVTGRKTDFPSTIDDKGTYMVSGFDGSIITMLLGGDVAKEGGKMPSMEEAVEMSLAQEILLQAKV